MTISSSSLEDSLRIAESLRAAVFAEGRERGGHAYMVQDARGRCFFEFYKPGTGKPVRKFSQALEASLRANAAHLRRWVEWQNRLTSRTCRDQPPR